MGFLDRFRHDHITLSSDETELLANPWYEGSVIEIHPPPQGGVPATIPTVVRTIQELQSTRFGLRNASPITAFEIRRPQPDTLRLQIAVPTTRLERKLRTHLDGRIPGIGFSDGTSGLPVTITDEPTIGGALLTAGRRDWYPFHTEFSQPPTNHVIGALHPHAMQQTRFVIQILFQPVAGKPLRRWWNTRRAYKRIGYLRKEKEQLWNSRSPTPRETNQADAIETKIANPRFRTSIRMLVINGGEYTRSRVKEVAGAFNVYEHPETGQFLNIETVTPFRRQHVLRFCRAVAQRRFARWSRSFHTTADELGALLAVPNREQSNLRYAEP